MNKICTDKLQNVSIKEESFAGPLYCQLFTSSLYAVSFKLYQTMTLSFGGSWKTKMLLRRDCVIWEFC